MHSYSAEAIDQSPLSDATAQVTELLFMQEQEQ